MICSSEFRNACHGASRGASATDEPILYTNEKLLHVLVYPHAKSGLIVPPLIPFNKWLYIVCKKYSFVSVYQGIYIYIYNVRVTLTRIIHMLMCLGSDKAWPDGNISLIHNNSPHYGDHVTLSESIQESCALDSVRISLYSDVGNRNMSSLSVDISRRISNHPSTSQIGWNSVEPQTNHYDIGLSQDREGSSSDDVTEMNGRCGGTFDGEHSDAHPFPVQGNSSRQCREHIDPTDSGVDEASDDEVVERRQRNVHRISDAVAPSLNCGDLWRYAVDAVHIINSDDDWSEEDEETKLKLQDAEHHLVSPAASPAAAN